MTRRRLVTALVAVAMSSLAFTPPAARATTVTIDECSPFIGTEWQSSWDEWEMTPRCPDAALIERAAASTQMPRWVLDPIINAPVVAIRARFPDEPYPAELDVRLRACTGGASGTCAVISEPAAASPRESSVSLSTGDLPVGVQWLELTIDCGTECKAGAAIQAPFVEIDFDDDQPPQHVIEPVEDGISVRNLRMPGWNSRSVGLRWWVLDSTGVATQSVQVDDQTRDLPSECELAVDWLTRVCNFGDIALLDTSAFADGRHTLRFRATDLAGHPAEQELEFATDNTPPEIGTAWIESNTPHGWTSATMPMIAWTNLGESVQTETQAGITVMVLETQEPVYGSYVRASPALTPTTGRVVGVPDGIWHVRVRTRDRALNVSPSYVPLTLRIDRARPPAPVLDEYGWISAADIEASRPLTWEPPALSQSNISGICGYAAAITQAQQFDPGTTIQVTDAAMALPRLADGIFKLYVRAVSCAGMASDVVANEIAVDATAPVVGLDAPDSATGWIADQASVGVTAYDAGSGVDAIDLTVDGQVVPLATTTARITLAEGRHEVRAEAVDVAGNRAPPVVSEVLVDASPPHAFLSIDPARPTVINATASDGLSGLANGRIEYRRAGDGGTWQVLGAQDNLSAAPSGLVTGRFADTGEPGIFEVRAVFQDVAGHVSVSSITFDGLPLTIKTPLRALPRITAGLARVCAPAQCRGSRSRRVLRVRFGTRTVLRGTLSDDLGKPLDGRRVWVRIEARGGAVSHRGITTDDRGRFSAQLAPGVSRTVTATFDGSETLRPVHARAQLEVSPRIALTAKVLRSHRGPVLWVDGRVASSGTVLPRGEPVELQLRRRGHWQAVGELRLKNEDGEFSGAWLVESSRSLRFTLRASITGTARWPFAAGRSNVARTSWRPR